MARRFVISDIHGAHKALKQCLKKAKFDKEKDTLICLGDIVDGWPEAPKCIDTLRKIKKLVLVLGNHDKFFLDWATKHYLHPDWLQQGGFETIQAFSFKPKKKYLKFFEQGKPYHVHKNKLFVHGGVNWEIPFKKNTEYNFQWDRSLVKEAIRRKEIQKEKQVTKFEEVYVGHTPVQRNGYTIPTKACEVWMIDTGCRWNGPLSLMDIETKEVFQSDPAYLLYE